MNVIQAQRHLHGLRQREQIVKICEEGNAAMRKLNREFPFCETCGQRAPASHKHGWPWNVPLFPD